MEKRKQAAFDRVYQGFAAELVSEINKKVWNSIRFDELDSVTTYSLFLVYKEYLEK